MRIEGTLKKLKQMHLICYLGSKIPGYGRAKARQSNNILSKESLFHYKKGNQHMCKVLYHMDMKHRPSQLRKQKDWKQLKCGATEG